MKTHSQKEETMNGTEASRDISRQSLGEFGPYLAMRPLGRNVQEKLDARLRALPSGGVLVVDFDGVQMMDYSFADEALGTILSRMAAKEYPDRHLVIEVRGDELSDALLENVEVALNRREVAALVLPQNAAEKTFQKAANISAVAGKWRSLGDLPTHLVDTLRAVMDKGCVTVRDLSEALKLDSATACNNRIARLYQMHLVRREATVVPEGGRQYCYSAVV
jgi:hypothetical protein